MMKEMPQIEQFEEGSEIEKTETNEKGPEISYDILYGPHRTEKDFEKAKEIFSEADVYVPELVGWNRNIAQIYNEVSQGKTTPELLPPEYFEYNPHLLRDLKMVEGSKKPILFVDIPQNHELLEQNMAAKKLRRKSFNLFKEGQFELALKIMRESLEVFNNHLEDREDLIKNTLKEKVNELAERDSDLKEKSKINVLLTLGAGHTPVYHDLKKEGLSVSSKSAYPLMVWDSFTEAGKKMRLSKNKEVDDELLANIFIERFIYPHLSKATEDSNKMAQAGRKISSKLDLQEIKEISEEFGKGPEKDIIHILEERSIKIPKTEKEIDKMLNV